MLDDTELLKREEIVVKRDIKTTSSKIEVYMNFAQVLQLYI